MRVTVSDDNGQTVMSYATLPSGEPDPSVPQVGPALAQRAAIGRALLAALSVIKGRKLSERELLADRDGLT
jgi:hypothetical protein